MHPVLCRMPLSYWALISSPRKLGKLSLEMSSSREITVTLFWVSTCWRGRKWNFLRPNTMRHPILWFGDWSLARYVTDLCKRKLRKKETSAELYLEPHTNIAGLRSIWPTINGEDLRLALIWVSFACWRDLLTGYCRLRRYLRKLGLKRIVLANGDSFVKINYRKLIFHLYMATWRCTAKRRNRIQHISFIKSVHENLYV